MGPTESRIFLNYARYQDCDQDCGRADPVGCCWNRSLVGIDVAGPHSGDDAPHAYWPVRGWPHDVHLERRCALGPAGAAGSEAGASCLDLVPRSATTTISVSC